jgi:hypothetical protein
MNQDKPAPAEKRRSPVERFIVQGGIFALLIILAVEFRAVRGYSVGLKALKAISDADESGTPMSEVEAALPLFPAKRLVSENAIEQTWEYSWLSIFKRGQFAIRIVTSRDDSNSGGGSAEGKGSTLHDAVEMVRYYTGTEDTSMEVRELSPDEIKPLPPGGLRIGGGPSEPPPASDSGSDESPAGENASSTDESSPANDAATPKAETESPAAEPPRSGSPGVS